MLYRGRENKILVDGQEVKVTEGNDQELEEDLEKTDLQYYLSWIIGGGSTIAGLALAGFATYAIYKCCKGHDRMDDNPYQIQLSSRAGGGDDGVPRTSVSPAGSVDNDRSLHIDRVSYSV